MQIGEYEVPDEIVYAYASVINGSGTQIYYHTKVFEYMTENFEEFKRFFSYNEIVIKSYDSNGRQLGECHGWWDNIEDAEAALKRDNANPCKGYHHENGKVEIVLNTKPNDINIETAQSYSKWWREEKPEGMIGEFHRRKTLATFADGIKVMDFEIALDAKVRQILEKPTLKDRRMLNR